MGALVAGESEAVERGVAQIRRRRWARQGCSGCAGVLRGLRNGGPVTGTVGSLFVVSRVKGARERRDKGKAGVLGVGPVFIGGEVGGVVCIVLAGLSVCIGRFVTRRPRATSSGL